MRDLPVLLRGPGPRRRPTAGLLRGALLLTLLGSPGCSRESTPPVAPRVPGPELAVVEGEDYALPSWATAEPFTGYVDAPDAGQLPSDRRQRSWWVGWRALEPVRGQYNWALMDSVLAAARAGGYSLSFHLQSVVCGGGNPALNISVPNVVPDWVISDFGLTGNDIVDLGGSFHIRMIPAWRPEIRAAFAEFLVAFGERGYPRMDEIATAYVHGLSPSRGEEFCLNQYNIDALVAYAGMTPEALEAWIDSRLDAYATAFAGVTQKLAWVGSLDSWRYCDPAYAAVAVRLFHRAWDLGMGTRGGGIEYYHYAVNEPAYGQAVDPDGYLTVDESIPTMATVRYFGDENEEYGEAWSWRFGGTGGDALRYRFSILRALQMRMRFLVTDAPAERINPALSAYARLSFGKNVDNSPDAWARLTESPAGEYWSRARVLRNLERWLLQRDVPGGMTVPTLKVTRTFNTGALPVGADSAFYDFTARRTDVVSGNRYICFRLDDRFTVAGPVEIKAEIVDRGAAAWRIEYTDAAGDTLSTPAYRNRGDGAVRTVTFALERPVFSNGLAHDTDFRIVCDGPGDTTVKFVRLIRSGLP